MAGPSFSQIRAIDVNLSALALYALLVVGAIAGVVPLWFGIASIVLASFRLEARFSR